MFGPVLDEGLIVFYVLNDGVVSGGFGLCVSDDLADKGGWCISHSATLIVRVFDCKYLFQLIESEVEMAPLAVSIVGQAATGNTSSHGSESPLPPA